MKFWIWEHDICIKSVSGQVSVLLRLWQPLIIIFGHLHPFPTNLLAIFSAQCSLYSCIVGWEQLGIINPHDYQDVYRHHCTVGTFWPIFLKPSTMVWIFAGVLQIETKGVLSSDDPNARPHLPCPPDNHYYWNLSTGQRGWVLGRVCYGPDNLALVIRSWQTLWHHIKIILSTIKDNLGRQY